MLHHHTPPKMRQPQPTALLQPHRDPEPKVPANLHLDLTHRNCEIINVCCFKPLEFAVTCYTSTVTQYMTPPQGSGFSNSIDRLEVFFQVTTNMELMAINFSVKKFLPWEKKKILSCYLPNISAWLI